MSILKETLSNFIENPKNPFYNFYVALAYEKLGHSAAAIGFYIRVAENNASDLLAYESLLRLALCLNSQGSRVFTVKGVLLRAVSVLPERPEAYFLLSRVYEVNKDWQEAYTWAIIGEQRIQDNLGSDSIGPVGLNNLLTDVEYPGSYGFAFEKAVSAWWIGLYSESLYLFKMLLKNPGINKDMKLAAFNNLNNLSDAWQEPLKYKRDLYERLKIKFKGSENIIENYSQCYQDMFVLYMLDGKISGRFLEIGSGDPYYGNNTALLEEKFKWKGIAIDISKESISKYKKHRKALTVLDDATKISYKGLLELNHYDYLQIDCDPASVSLQVLLKIPFEAYSFSVITFEHDHYRDKSDSVKKRSRAYLSSLGYVLAISDVSINKFNSFEDWWVNPKYVSLDKLKSIDNSDNISKIEDVLFTKY